MKTLSISLFIMIYPLSVSAVQISIGSLSSNDDGSTNVITDTKNNREWLRWDQLAHATYAETVAAISAGGVYDGFSVANNHDVTLFVDALFGATNACYDEAPVIPDTQGTNCGFTLPGDYINLVGVNHQPGVSVAWFFNEYNDPALAPVGALYVQEGFLTRDNTYGDIALTDFFTDEPFLGGDPHPVTWLLWREATVVPIPAAIWLFASGILVFTLAAQKKSVT